MSRIKGKDTKPELLIRKSLYEKGYRYRVNTKVFGKPDIVFLSKKIAVFIHGCFWHRHGCKNTTMPKSNISFWYEKFEKNIIRDNNVKKQLKKEGWKVIVLWECEIKKDLNKQIKFLESILN